MSSASVILGFGNRGVCRSEDRLLIARADAVPERRRRRFTASGALVILARQCAQIRRSGRNGRSVAAANSGGRGASKDTRGV